MSAGTLAEPAMIGVDAPAAWVAARQAAASHGRGPGITLAGAVRGFFVITLTYGGAVLTLFSARLAERLTTRKVITAGLGVTAAGLAVVGCAPAATPVWAFAALMVVVGLAGPLVSPPITAVLLNSVPDHQAGTASGVFNISRQVGGALAVAVFGALLSRQGDCCTDCASVS